MDNIRNDILLPFSLCHILCHKTKINGSDSVGTLYRDPIERLAFAMSNMKKSEDISDEAYTIIHCQY